MTDPVRWSEAGDSASPIEQVLVRAGQDVSMPSDERNAIWDGILSAIPAGALVPRPLHTTPAAQAVATAGTTSLLMLKGAKILCVLAAVAGLGVGGYHWLKVSRLSVKDVPPQASESPGVLPSPSVLVVAPRANEVPEPATEPLRSEPTTTPPAAAVPTLSRASQLKEESLAVMAARQALRSNDPTKALHLLDQAQQRFRRGALAEEREALTIEALAKAGQGSRASARAQTFLTQYPRSPHAADVQRFITQ